MDQLPETEFEAARRFLEYLRDHGEGLVSGALGRAPADDEPLSAEELADLEEALRDCAAGRLIWHEEARRRLADQRRREASSSASAR